MMPHPERMIDNLISNTDGVNIFKLKKLKYKLLKIIEKHGLKLGYTNIQKLLKEILIYLSLFFCNVE